MGESGSATDAAATEARGGERRRRMKGEQREGKQGEETAHLPFPSAGPSPRPSPTLLLPLFHPEPALVPSLNPRPLRAAFLSIVAAVTSSHRQPSRLRRHQSFPTVASYLPLPSANSLPRPPLQPPYPTEFPTPPPSLPTASHAPSLPGRRRRLQPVAATACPQPSALPPSHEGLKAAAGFDVVDLDGVGVGIELCWVDDYGRSMGWG
ncbi:hypothetical protein Droror1_Dr00003231 [Drosera rotundifolia]